ncbi:MAG: efflux RND transporter periplasmic adaptor subunit, partial [Candidatus Omnitrophica bacterium]|nr:efflux RND transporter periplasmic adaptor subunit [Candidatus Omnitrophota bacterium]
MSLVLMSCAVVVNLAHSQQSEAPSNDGWEIEVSEDSDHGHAHGEDAHGHGDSDEKTTAVTVWGDRFEIFLEHPYIVAGEPTPFITHVTDLQELVPRTEGQIEFVLRLGTDLPIGRVAKTPVRDGIYIPELTFPKAGTWDISILIPLDGEEHIVKLPPTEVYASEGDVADAPEQEEIEGITFLKEQQWKFPFETVEFKSGSGDFSVPEQAVVKGESGPMVFVHVAGETVQPRVVETEEPKDGRIVILSGLQDGDRVVVRGTDAILVSAESDSGGGHAHGEHGEEEEDHGHEHGASEEAEGDHGHEHGTEDSHSHGEDDHGHEHGAAGHGADDHAVGAIHLSEEMRSSLDLTTAAATKGDLVRTLDVYGWVRPRQESMTEVRAPVTGIVKEILTTPGATLMAGDPIVTLQSREILEWQQTILIEGNRRKKLEDTKALLEAEGRAKMVELLGGLRVDAAEKKRISTELDLIEKAGTGSVAQREVNKIRGELESARASLQAKETLAEAYGLSANFIAKVKAGEADIRTQNGDLPPDYRRQLREVEFNIQSSLTEEKVAVTNLQSLGFEEDRLSRLREGDPDAVVNTITLRAESPFLVTDLLMKRQSSLNLGDPILAGVDYSEVLIDAEIPEVEIDQTLSRASDTVPIRIPALDNRVFEAKVLFFDTTVHSGDRKAHLVLSLENTEDQALRDGMAASVGIPVEIRHDALTVPKESVLNDGLEKVVFVADGDAFVK